MKRAVEGEITKDVAATFLQRHQACTFYVDRAAAADLTRIATPWLLVTAIEWTDALAVRAVVWLSLAKARAILKLTHSDYAEHHLASLVAKYGSPGEVNGFVFNHLGAKIRGKSKLPRDQRVLCFSPHPDDDVISMGGILRKLVENSNDITVAYMTSGNIAVFDHDVRRYVDFLERLARDRETDLPGAAALRTRVLDFLQRKKPGDVDSDEILDIKRIIRESEAISGIETLGLPPQAARFLNLPFYQTGKVRKDPIGPTDVRIVHDLLIETSPDHIFLWPAISRIHTVRIACVKKPSSGRCGRYRRRRRVPRCGSTAEHGKSGQ